MSEATLTYVQLPPAVAEDFAQLEKRASRLSKQGRWWLGAAGVATAVAGIAMAVAYWLGPSASITSVEIPPVVINAFSDAVSSGGAAGMPWESAASQLTGILTGWFPKILAILMIAAGGLAMAFTGDRKLFMTAGMAAGPILFLPFIMGVFGEGPVERSSPREDFVSAVKAGNVETVSQALARIDASALNRTYILAQSALVQAGKGTGSMPAAAHRTFVDNVRLLDELSASDGKARFLLDDQVMYALDLAAHKSPTSAMAKGYLEKTEQRQATAVRLRDVFLWPALVLGGLGCTMLLLGRHLRQRVERIKPLLGSEGSTEQPPLQEQRA